MKIAILGFGREGKAVLKFLKKSRPLIKPVILDKKRNPNYLKNLGQFDVIYRSPGVPYNLPPIQNALKSGVKFSSGTDLFFKNAKGTIIGITGTKGKSTTSTLLYRILKNAGRDVYLGGNIGKPAIELLSKLRKKSVTVLELSSFQLQDLKYSPHIAVILDIFPDHLDIHQNFKEYSEAKKSIIKFQKSNDLVFYFSDSKQVRVIAGKSKGKKIPVSPDIQIPEIKIIGPHNRKNIAMVIAVAKELRVPQKTIFKTLKSFGGLPHRLKLIKTLKGVKFYNDSASTNPETTAAAIMSFPNHSKIIIMGGKDKNLDYEPVAEAAYAENIKLVVLFGENKKKIHLALDKVAKTKTAKDLKSAVKTALQSAKSGDIVIFSPGAASFDMFENYKARGREFTRIVKKMNG